MLGDAQTERTAQAKYGNRKTEVDGIVFDSRAEARRYQELKLMQHAGEIVDLELQPAYPLTVNGTKIGTYRADFLYIDIRIGQCVVEDVKSRPTMTPVYRIKKKLMKAIYNIDIVEVTA